MTENYVLVTGAAGGLGSAISRELASRGIGLILHYNSRSAEASDLKKEVEKMGVNAETVSADLSNLEGLEKLHSKISDMGVSLSGIVNNAGTSRPGNASNIKEDDWDFVQNVNVKGPVMLVSKLNHLFAKPASVVNIASAAGIRAGLSSIAYEASKASLIHATRSMALSLAPDVRVNAVAPGFVVTNINRARLSDEKIKQEIIRRTPLKRLGKPEDIGKLVGFLMSEDSGFITGETIVIDGGITLA